MHVKQQRKCIACRESKMQKDLLRITKINNVIALDVLQKLGGRGAYVCKNSNCINMTIKKHLFNKAFKTNVEREIYNSLGEYEKNY